VHIRAGLPVGGIVAQMAAHVAYEIGSDAPLHEAPLPVAALEAVLVATANDGLQSQVGQRLKRSEVRTRDRCARLFVDLDGDIGGDVLGPWRAVVVDIRLSRSIVSMASRPLTDPALPVKVASASRMPTPAKSPSSASSA
jgi:hypothetical protein